LLFLNLPEPSHFLSELCRAGDRRSGSHDAARVVERWNKAIASGRDMWWSPTIRAAIVGLSSPASSLPDFRARLPGRSGSSWVSI